MRILTVLTYYRPHTSGLTIYAERLAEAFVRRGHEVTVLTSHFDKSTPAEELRNGVKVGRNGAHDNDSAFIFKRSCRLE